MIALTKHTNDCVTTNNDFSTQAMSLQTITLTIEQRSAETSVRKKVKFDINQISASLYKSNNSRPHCTSHNFNLTPGLTGGDDIGIGMVFTCNIRVGLLSLRSPRDILNLY